MKILVPGAGLVGASAAWYPPLADILPGRKPGFDPRFTETAR